MRHVHQVALSLALSLLAPTLADAQPARAPAPAPAPVLTKPPKLTRFVEAEYPESERARGRAAVVVLRLTLDAAGNVQDASVAESAGAEFDAAAIAAARRFVFEPAEVDNKPSPI